ncbi:MAG: DUF898 family protein [Pelomonas sp.]|nr:DUF898 family protein [Roseateles sp.]
MEMVVAADPMPAAAPVPAPQAPAWRELPLRFTGSGVEYLRIWLLHLLLIVVTLGLYLPFAKARRLRYLQANTWVDGDALGFHGDPRTMFRGFMVLVALFGVYAVGGRFAPLAGYVAFLGLCVLWPALWRAGQQFRLANTSWRGLRLAFRGDLGDAYAAFGVVIWPLVVMVGVQRVAADIVTGRVAVSARWVEGVATAIVAVGGIGTLLYVGLLPLALAKVKRYQHNHYQIAGQRTQLQVKTRRFYALAASTAAWVVVPLLLLGALLMVPAVRGLFESRQTLGLAIMGGVLAAYLLGFMLVVPYFHARLQNLVWNHTASEQLRLSSALRFRDLAWMTTKNWVFTLLTLGLYRPFAVINTCRLRVQALRIEVCGSLDGWDGRDSAAYADAAGEAAGDFFGIDVGL